MSKHYYFEEGHLYTKDPHTYGVVYRALEVHETHVVLYSLEEVPKREVVFYDDLPARRPVAEQWPIPGEYQVRRARKTISEEINFHLEKVEHLKTILSMFPEETSGETNM